MSGNPGSTYKLTLTQPNLKKVNNKKQIDLTAMFNSGCVLMSHMLLCATFISGWNGSRPTLKMLVSTATRIRGESGLLSADPCLASPLSSTSCYGTKGRGLHDGGGFIYLFIFRWGY